MANLGSNNNRKIQSQYEQRHIRQQRDGQQSSAKNEAGIKARNRFIGAVVLIIAAVIILPMLFNSSKDNNVSPPTQAPLVAPVADQSQATSGTLSVQTAPGVSTGNEVSGTTVTSTQTDQGSTVIAPVSPTESAQQPISVAQGTNPDFQPPVAAKEDTKAIPEVAKTTPAEPTKPEVKPVVTQNKSKPAKTPASKITIADKDRTDDGAKALALLEGKSSPRTSSAKTSQSAVQVTSGTYNVQVAAYATAGDAREQRDKLRNSGVTNAFIQTATANGKQVYRLRVGPFSSRESAQAAQTRVRALNYDGSFVTNK